VPLPTFENMKLKIEITMDNAAFEAEGENQRLICNADEPSRILRQLTVGWPGTTLGAGDTWDLRDVNGNTVGKAKVTQ